MNTYGYVQGNPIRYTDPYGLCVGPLAPLCVGGASEGGVLAAGGAVNNSSNSANQGAAIALDNAVGNTLNQIDQINKLNSTSLFGAFIFSKLGIMCSETAEEREKRCEENLERDLESCRANGRRHGKGSYAICERQAMERYGNCLSGRDRNIDTPLPPFGTRP